MQMIDAWPRQRLQRSLACIPHLQLLDPILLNLPIWQTFVHQRIERIPLAHLPAPFALVLHHQVIDAIGAPLVSQGAQYILAENLALTVLSRHQGLIELSDQRIAFGAIEAGLERSLFLGGAVVVFQMQKAFVEISRAQVRRQQLEACPSPFILQRHMRLPRGTDEAVYGLLPSIACIDLIPAVLLIVDELHKPTDIDHAQVIIRASGSIGRRQRKLTPRLARALAIQLAALNPVRGRVCTPLDLHLRPSTAFG
ncbi:hypothetical protein C6V06_23405 [Burkholderia gladioli]|nr:hypothetical protein C6V06_23405 [Burkholderia gladioli]